MSSLAITGIVFACLFGGVILGTVLRAILPEHHLSGPTKEVVHLGMGLVGTMTALVLGLLVASTKASFDAQRMGVTQLSANLVLLDRVLAHYGPESKDARDMLHAAVSGMLEQIWPGESSDGAQVKQSLTPGRYEGLYEKIQELAPKTDGQRTLQSQALKIAVDIGQTRWMMFAQQDSSIPMPFLIVLVFWLTILMASFSMFAPRNATVFLTLLISALAISSAVFLILELDRPYGGVIQVSSRPLRNALGQLGN